jgi:hypothetical protein
MERQAGSVSVKAIESNQLPVVLEKFSLTGRNSALEKSDCEPGQVRYPGKSC